MTRPLPRLVFAGAGHANLIALVNLFRDAPPAHITLVSRSHHAHYSGMIPGWIEGLYSLADASIDLRALSRKNGFDLIIAEIASIDENTVRFSDGGHAPYDILALNTGAEVVAAAPLDNPRIVPAKPFEKLVDGLAPVLDSSDSFAIVGAGVAGVEVSLALAQRRPGAQIALVDRSDTLLSPFPKRFRRYVQSLLDARGIAVRLGASVIEVTDTALVLASGEELPAATALAFTGAAAPQWLHRTPFILGEDGFVITTNTLAAAGHPNVFVVGDVANRIDDPRPKAGVFAVRSGPILARAIRASLSGHPAHSARLQKRGLVLLATGNRHAVGTRNGLTAHGRWVWRFKDRFDRAFIAQFRVHDGVD